MLFKNDFINKLSFVTISQCVSLFSSAFMLLFLPRVMEVHEYGYWQMFLLYSGYVGMLHFGYSDGLYIRLGGRNLSMIPKKEVSSQITFFVLSQLFFGCLIFLISIFYIQNYNKYILCFIAAYLVVENLYKLFSYILLATDNSIIYSKSVLIDKLLFLAFLVLFLFYPYKEYIYIVISYIICRSFALIFIYNKIRINVNFGKIVNFKQTFNKVISICSLGIILMISTILGSLIISVGRYLVEYFWDITMFANISLAISLSFFILAIVSQVSLVLFPFICNADESKRRYILKNGSHVLGFIAMASFGLYFVISLFVRLWLPQYVESANYIIFLFPLVLFEIKISILYNTYFKALEKLNILLIVNLVVLFLSVILYFVAIYLKRIECVLLSMTISQLLRNLLLKHYLDKYYNLALDKYIFVEILYSTLFLLIYYLLGNNYLLLFYFISIVVLAFIYWNKLKNIKSIIN